MRKAKITLTDLLCGNDWTKCSPEQQTNALELGKAINAFFDVCPIKPVVTSGFRSPEHHINIYKKKLGKNFDIKKVPMKSKHLSFQAVDIADPDGSLWAYCQNAVPLLDKLGLWLEDDPATPRVHFQIVPPLSGKRFFKP